ncbi:MAG: diguanylate cyclase [Nitrospirae bacterium]|nr:diguanylate cyclase [Nitrospirota bacterium]
MIQLFKNLFPIRSIYTKLFFLFSIIGVIPLVIGSLYMYSNSRDALINVSLKEQELDVNNGMRNIVILFVESNDNLLLTSHNASFSRYFEEPEEAGLYKKDQENSLLRLALLSPGLIESAGFADMSGRVINYVYEGNLTPPDSMNISNISGRPFFSQVKAFNQGKVYNGMPELSESSRKWIVPFATPVFSSKGKPLGILFMQIYLDRINRFIRNIVHPDNTVFVIDQEGRLIAHSEMEAGETLRPSFVTEDDQSFKSAIKYMLSGGSNNMNIIYNGKPSYISYKTVPVTMENQNRWSIGVITSEENIFAGISAKKYIFFVLSICVLLFGTAGIIGYRIAHPIQELTLTSIAMSKGDLTSRVTIDRKDEIGQLANAFNEMAIAIQTSHEDLVKLSSTDGLTGLYNHREFQKRLEVEIERAYRYSYNLSLLMIDIDNFKKFNDTYGHQTGDLVLQSLSSTILKDVRMSDFAARYGGEEIAIILPSSDSEEAFIFSDRLRKHINQIPIQVMGDRIVHVSVSIGIASFPQDATDRKGLIDAADQTLYFAKDSGKNNAVLYKDTLKAAMEQRSSKPQTLLEQAEEWIFKGIYSAVEAKIPFHRGQLNSMSNVTAQLAEYMYLNEEDTRDLKIATMLHDVGIFNIPFQVLQKPGSLTGDEWKLVKSHPEIGVNLLNQILKISNVLPAILHHHERFDGTGYPSGLKGEEIPLLARIITVVDSYFAMTSISPYKRRLSQDEAIEELMRNSGTQFDPNIVSAFIKILKKDIKEADISEKTFL